MRRGALIGLILVCGVGRCNPAGILLGGGLSEPKISLYVLYRGQNKGRRFLLFAVEKKRLGTRFIFRFRGSRRYILVEGRWSLCLGSEREGGSMNSHPMNGNGHPHGFKTDLVGIRDSDAKALRQKIVSAVNEAELSAGGQKANERVPGCQWLR
jgi:hypothetical protein